MQKNCIVKGVVDRRDQMSLAVKKGLEKTEELVVKKKAVANVVKGVSQAMAVVGAGLKSSREATLFWAALTAILPASRLDFESLSYTDHLSLSSTPVSRARRIAMELSLYSQLSERPTSCHHECLQIKQLEYRGASTLSGSTRRY